MTAGRTLAGLCLAVAAGALVLALRFAERRRTCAPSGRVSTNAIQKSSVPLTRTAKDLS